MSNPRLTYNGKIIDFTQDCFDLQYDIIRAAKRNASASGVVETLNVRIDVIIEMSFRNFVNANAVDATLKRNLAQWLAWAQAGGAWTFTRDYAEMVLTTLTGAEAAGQTVIGLTSTAGIDAGGLYIIRSAYHAELAKVLTVDSSVQVTLVESLNHSYSAGDRFRSEQYWPGRLIDLNNPVQEMPPLWYDVAMSFIEDVNDI